VRRCLPLGRGPPRWVPGRPRTSRRKERATEIGRPLRTHIVRPLADSGAEGGPAGAGAQADAAGADAGGRAGTVSVAPDYAAPLIGWRAWAAVEEKGAIMLRSVMFETRWPPRERLEAACVNWPRSGLLARLLRIEPHEAPDEGCECGIYATHAADLALPYLDRSVFLPRARSALIGRVALWGRVIECERGWRGAFAYPTHLYLLSAAPTRRQQADAHSLAGRLAR